MWEYPDHGHIIDVEEANKIGLSNVEYMSPQMEDLCIVALSEPPPFVMAVAPENTSDSSSERNSLEEGDDYEYEAGNSCDQ